MNKETINNIVLGLFVSIGIILLIASIYFIGSKKNMFSSTFQVIAIFNEVNGLQSGDNVRLKGIDIGTVKSVIIINDSTVRVTMLIETKNKAFLKKNAVASIGTDGLMGNKLLNLRNGKLFSESVQKNDTLKTMPPFESDEMFRTLSATNDNVKFITDDLKSITQKIKKSNSLWNLLSDTIFAENVRQAMVNIKLTSNRSAIITGDLSSIVQNVKSGKGSIGALLTDTTFSKTLKQTIVEIKMVSDSMALISGDLRNVFQKIKNGNGAVGTIFMDTTFVHNLNKSMENIKSGSEGFSENMEALKHSFLLRKYFKKQEKEKGKKK